MNMTNYQMQAHKTAQYNPDTQLTYVALGLAGEAGEVANKVKKVLRDWDGTAEDMADRRAAIIDELGDVLWYLAEMCTALDTTLDHVAGMNLLKLEYRALANKIQGDGDNR